MDELDMRIEELLAEHAECRACGYAEGCDYGGSAGGCPRKAYAEGLKLRGAMAKRIMEGAGHD